MKDWIGLVVRLVTGGVWIVAGALKLPDPSESVRAVRAYEILPGTWSVPVGQFLPVAEIALGTMLVLGILTRGSALVSSLMYLMFAVAIASLWARGINVDCGCFGGGGFDPDAQSKYPVEIARDVALSVASLAIVRFPGKRFSFDSMLLAKSSNQ